MSGLLSSLSGSEVVSFMGVLEREGVTAEDIRFIVRYRMFANNAAGEMKRGGELTALALTASPIGLRMAALQLIHDPEVLRDIALCTKGRMALVALEKMPWNYASMVAMKHNDLKIVSAAMRKVIDPLLDDWIKNWPQGARRRRAVRERARRRKLSISQK
jgi:hypothetical protein